MMNKLTSIAHAVVMTTALASVVPAHAAQWKLSFNDLHHVLDDYSGNPIDYGNVTLTGVLYANDANHDNHIDLSEVQVLSIGGYGFSRAEISTFYFTGDKLHVSAISFEASLDSSGLFYSSGGYADNFYAGPMSAITVTSAVPEPATLAMMFVGLLGFAGCSAVRRRVK